MQDQGRLKPEDPGRLGAAPNFLVMTRKGSRNPPLHFPARQLSVPEKIPPGTRGHPIAFHSPGIPKNLPAAKSKSPPTRGMKRTLTGAPSRSWSLPPLPRGQMPRPRAENREPKSPALPPFACCHARCVRIGSRQPLQAAERESPAGFACLRSRILNPHT